MRSLQRQIHKLSQEKGWWSDDRPFAELLFLASSELTEAFEEYRKGRGITTVYKSTGGKPEGVPIELADCIIRILDFCEFYDIDIEQMIIRKHEYNKTREWRHGGKLA